MTSFYLTPDARDDIADIWEFIAQDSVAAADRVEQAIVDACERIGSSPGIGHRRSDTTALPVRLRRQID